MNKEEWDTYKDLESVANAEIGREILITFFNDIYKDELAELKKEMNDDREKRREN